jgi:hypothetical protein
MAMAAMAAPRRVSGEAARGSDEREEREADAVADAEVGDVARRSEPGGERVR